MHKATAKRIRNGPSRQERRHPKQRNGETAPPFHLESPAEPLFDGPEVGAKFDGLRLFDRTLRHTFRR